MEKKSLEEKLVSIQQQFDAVSKTKSDAEAEMLRLQGDYRTIEGLIASLVDKVEVKETKNGK